MHSPEINSETRGNVHNMKVEKVCPDIGKKYFPSCRCSNTRKGAQRGCLYFTPGNIQSSGCHEQPVLMTCFEREIVPVTCSYDIIYVLTDLKKFLG